MDITQQQKQQTILILVMQIHSNIHNIASTIYIYLKLYTSSEAINYREFHF